VLSFSNLVISTLTKIIFGLEQWDFKDDELNNELWRKYIGKILTFTAFLIVLI
jgi:hypothetical protein